MIEAQGLTKQYGELYALNRLTLERLTDDSNVNAAFVYHRAVTDADIADLQRIGIRGGTRFRVLPVVVATGTANQIAAVSRLPAVRSIYGNRTLQTTADPYRAPAGAAYRAADCRGTASAPRPGPRASAAA